jgi:hypothetical protein
MEALSPWRRRLQSAHWASSVALKPIRALIPSDSKRWLNGSRSPVSARFGFGPLLGPAVFECHIVSLDVAKFVQILPERFKVACGGCRGDGH